MKNIKEILKHLPLPYDKIKIQKCLKLLINGLPIHYKNNILYMYLKGETLYFVTKHQAINFELYQKLSDIRLMLTLIQKKTGKCKSIKISNLKAFSTYTKKQTTTNKNNDIKFYLKIKNSEFKNKAKNKKVYDKFEEIRSFLSK